MIVALIIALLLCAGIGTFFNYLGIEIMRCAFELAGGSAIGMFLLGLLITMGSLIAFCCFAQCGKLLITEIKYILKGGE